MEFESTLVGMLANTQALSRIGLTPMARNSGYQKWQSKRFQALKRGQSATVRDNSPSVVAKLVNTVGTLAENVLALR
jgi:hypothetical protein